MRLTRVDEPGEPSLYMERAPLKKEEMEEEINQLLFEITNAHWNRIVRYLLNKYQKQFFEFPAAKRKPSCICQWISLSYFDNASLREINRR